MTDRRAGKPPQGVRALSNAEGQRRKRQAAKRRNEAFRALVPMLRQAVQAGPTPEGRATLLAVLRLAEDGLKPLPPLGKGWNPEREED